MKNFVKRGILLLSAALLITALFTNCPPPVGGDVSLGGGGGWKPIPPNKGAVRFSFGNPKVRAIFPDLSDTANEIVFYQIDFKALTGDGVDHTEDDIDASSPISVNLEPGNYAFKVLAFTAATVAANTNTTDGLDDTDAVAYFESDHWVDPGTPTTSDLEITAGAANSDYTGTGSIRLLAFDKTTDGDGTFTYNINLTGVTTGWGATLTVNSLPYNTLTGKNLTRTQDLAPGSYPVLVTLDRGTLHITFPQALYIYQNMTSSFSMTVTDALFGITDGSGDFNFGPPLIGGIEIELEYQIGGAGPWTPIPTAGIPNIPILQNQSIEIRFVDDSDYDTSTIRWYFAEKGNVASEDTNTSVTLNNTTTATIDTSVKRQYLVGVDAYEDVISTNYQAFVFTITVG